MIIRLTVNDNDYGTLMNLFCSDLHGRLVSLPDDFSSISGVERFELLHNKGKLAELLNPNSVIENYTDADKDLIINRVHKCFKELIQKYSPDNVDYLMSNFKVTVPDSMEDKWENGEAWYWFQHSGKWLNQ